MLPLAWAALSPIGTVLPASVLPASGAGLWNTWAELWLGTAGVRRPTGTIVPGASIPVNLVHAADQPCEVSGHHSSGCDRDAPAVQIP